MTEDSNSQPSAEGNPYWAAAQERLRSAGVGVTHAAPKPAPSAYPYAAPIYPYPYAAYTPVAMPQASTPAAYNWYSTPAAPPPPPPPSFVPNRLPVPPRPQPRGANVPFNYNQIRPIRGQQRFNMNFNAAPTRPTSNPFSQPSTNNAQDDDLGDPNGGFYLRGKHPPSLKTYVKRALEHPKNPSDMRKCEDYLYGKIEPLILSGAVFAVKWDLEPLPHEKNYQLTTAWTPASVMKGKGPPPKETKASKFGNSSPFKNGKGPDILLSKPRKGKDRAPQLEGPIFARGPSAAAAAASTSTNGKKRKNKGAGNDAASSFFDHDAYFDSKRSRLAGDVGAAGAKYGTNHSDNWLEDWVAERRVRGSSSSGTLSRLQVLSFSEKPYRRAKAHLPPFDGSRLARTFPRVLRSMGQGIVNEYFDRNLDRFNPDDCEEVIGQSRELEKKYFRLTKKPDAAEIRPLHVLHDAFRRLQNIARQDPSKYKYICDQLRSIRQDLTVQKIRDHFTVAVYEYHARITLENKDLSEFNQCQSQLRHLYADLPGCKNAFEFTAYRLLYYIHTQDEQDILSLLNDLTPEARASPTIKYAIEVHDAYLKGSYIRLFKLFENAPRMCGNVMALFLERARRRFFSMIRVSFRPKIDVDVLIRWFNFDSARDFCEYMLTQGVSVKPGEKTEPPSWPANPPAAS
uniref:SAC3_GANP domain-containing protein n=1 Tax=Panagrellus redivivus TaxID=6233 RepID=A0A7E4UVV5_PANRE